MPESTSRLPWKRLFAEFLVIVLGVLMALAADAWWDRVARAEDERTSLAALRADAAEVLGPIESAIAEEESRLHALQSLLGVPDPSAQLIDSVDAWIRVGLWQVASHEFDFDAYDDLVNAGQLELVTDSEVRTLLSAIQRRMGRFARDQAEASSAQVSYVDPALLTGFDLVRIIPSDGVPPTNPSREHQALVRTKPIRNLLVAKSGFTRGSLTRLQGLQARFETLVATIDEAGGD